MTEPLDLRRLQFNPTDRFVPKRRQTVPRPGTMKGPFLKGPISWTWLSAAARLPGRALHVALSIRLLTGIKKSSRIALSVSKLLLLGVSRHAAYRGLTALEAEGLVSVDRHRGRKPMVTVIEIESDSAPVSSTPQSSQESKDV